MRRDNLRAIVATEILKNRNKWIGIVDISYETDASPRQISSILSQIPDVNLEFEQREWGRAVRLNADEEEAKRILTHIMYWRYHIDDVFDTLLNGIPTTGWISIHDLAAGAHMMQADVVMCIEWMRGDVQTKGTNKQMLCHRAGEYDVSEHKGAAVASDIGTER